MRAAGVVTIKRALAGVAPNNYTDVDTDDRSDYRSDQSYINDTIVERDDGASHPS
ncbi:MAG: hypothetical protein WAZ21_02610 [Candidatus Saccharimonadales bacterium]